MRGARGTGAESTKIESDMIGGRPVVGITQGDVNGIGYEVFLKAFSDARLLEMVVPVFYGLGRAAAYYRKLFGLQMPQFVRVASAREASERGISLVDVGGDLRVEPGGASRESALSAIMALESSVRDWKQGFLDAIVTLPVNKNVMQGAGFAYPGQTEYFAAQSGGNDPLMMMVSDDLRVGLVTQHLSLSDVPGALTQARVEAKIAQLAQSLREDFGIDGPRIAVLGLNPHAGEGGALGVEELTLIEPAIAAANAKGMLVSGAYAADGFFGAGRWREFDGVLAMYHDQGLIPFKALSFDRGVNFSAGLPVVRTSPDHGTGFDIAGKSVASAQSFRSAVYLSIQVARARKRERELRENALSVGALEAAKGQLAGRRRGEEEARAGAERGER